MLFVIVKGYEYFGYDPATYYSTEQQEIQLSSDTSFTSLDGGYEVQLFVPRGRGAKKME